MLVYDIQVQKKVFQILDNAAMIAMVGYLKYNNNDFSTLEKSAQARFKL